MFQLKKHIENPKRSLIEMNVVELPDQTEQKISSK